MASFEGPATSGAGGELLGRPAAASPMTDGPPEVPQLSPERAQQELARLTAIIKGNTNLRFLEPRVVKCMEDGTQDSMTFLSFYRLVSQSLSEELVNQKERLTKLEDGLVKARQVSSQNQMEEALAAASDVVTRVGGAPPKPSPQAQAQPAAEATDGAAQAERNAQVDELLRKLEQAEIQRERLLQDMQNMRNRAKTDIDVKVFKAVEKFTQSLLPALDAFHSAMPSLKTSTDTASIVTGIEMIHDQLQQALKQAGLTKMSVVGQPFDPRVHEAIGEVETTEMEDDHIYDELQPGYMFGERMVRAAIVRIARNNSPAAPAAAPPAPASDSSTPEASTSSTSAQAPVPSAPATEPAAAPTPASPPTAAPASEAPVTASPAA
ncbi:MAG TPA: nucleotide exchange factor GrpE, partial [Phycisphaerales bacterium]|nr:nucleotide exchange factor GrpE [Phycisphaerales bacterium]